MEEENSDRRTIFMEYLRLHRYWAHLCNKQEDISGHFRTNVCYPNLRKIGMLEVEIKNPTKSICGTNSRGAISVTSFTFGSRHPTKCDQVRLSYSRNKCTVDLIANITTTTTI